MLCVYVGMVVNRKAKSYVRLGKSYVQLTKSYVRLIFFFLCGSNTLPYVIAPN